MLETRVTSQESKLRCVPYPPKFTGQEHDSEFELYNYDARLYDPVMGRFITPDTEIPEGYNPQSLNRYAYCLNNPLIYIDPSGNFWQETDDGYVQLVGPPEPKNAEIETYLNDLWSQTSNSPCDEGSFISIETLLSSINTSMNIEVLTCGVLGDMYNAFINAMCDTRKAHEEGGLYKWGHGGTERSEKDRKSSSITMRTRFKDGETPELSFHIHPHSTGVDPYHPENTHTAGKAGDKDMIYASKADPSTLHFFITPQQGVWRYDSAGNNEFLGTIKMIHCYIGCFNILGN